jgi:hypothetical protein
LPLFVFAVILSVAKDPDTFDSRMPQEAFYRMSLKPALLLLALISVFDQPLHAQLQKRAAPPEPTTPAARRFADPRYHVALQIPAAWTLTRRDGEVSTFHLDARSAPATSQLRAVATIAFNPFPQSNFTGALVYFSVSPRTTDAACAAQSFLPLHRPATTTEIGGITFAHGSDEHGGICIESRDDVYTAFRNNACYRFDLVLNTFCGAEVSGVREMTNAEREDIHTREQSILNSLTLTP